MSDLSRLESYGGRSCEAVPVESPTVPQKRAIDQGREQALGNGTAFVLESVSRYTVPVRANAMLVRATYSATSGYGSSSYESQRTFNEPDFVGKYSTCLDRRIR